MARVTGNILLESEGTFDPKADPVKLCARFLVVVLPQSMQTVARVSQKVALFDLGNLVESGDTPAIFTNPKYPRSETFLPQSCSS